MCATGVAPGKAKKNVDYQSVQSPAEVRAREQKPIKNSRKSEIGGEESRKKSRNDSARSCVVRNAAADRDVRSLVAQLNERWRVVDDGSKWVLESFRDFEWCARTRVRIRHGLEHCVRRFAGDVDPAALAILAALPVEYRLKRPRRPRVYDNEPARTPL